MRVQRHLRRTGLRMAVAGLLAGPLALWAQPADPPVQPADWRQANEAVGAFPRGHADVLKWERSRAQASAAAEPAAVGPALPTAEAAVRAAWRLHPDLARPLARIGESVASQIAQGRWNEVDPALQRRVDDMDELLEVAASARKAWISAVAAQQRLRPQREALEAAETANELGQRMARVGNWSALQAARVQRAVTTERMNLQRTQAAALTARSALIKELGLAGLVTGVVLPDQLPAVPEQAMPATELQQRALAIRGQLPDTQGLRSRWLAPQAIETYGAAHALARLAQGEQLATQRFITEETLLHYNGMLKSVWDLLAEVRNRAQAEAEAIDAQRDFWLAEADVQWVLQGGEPALVLSLGAPGGADAAAGAAH